MTSIASLDTFSTNSNESSVNTANAKYRLNLHRIVNINTSAQNKFSNKTLDYPDNSVTSSKYSLLSFIPLNLFEQFHRAANIYFLIISILTTLPSSPKDPFSMIGTFVLVLSISAIKDGIEDYRRHIRDREINARRVQALNINASSFDFTEWADIHVGDVVKIKENEPVPADIIVLSTSDANLGTCFIDTSNLDGETNLKTRNAIEKTKHVSTATDLAKVRLLIECDKPTPDIFKFHGTTNFHAPNDESCSFRTSVGVANTIWRGCVLRNTKWAIGIAIYTGKDSKIVLNAQQTPSKFSNVQKIMNRLMIGLFCMQGVIVLLCSLAGVLWYNEHMDDFYLLWSTEQLLQEHASSFFTNVITYIVTFSHIIPISLYVAKEIIQSALAYLIQQDLKMFHNPSNTPARANTGNLIEELGQVKYVFTDKTGTLTQNQMVFKQCSVGGLIYGNPLSETDEQLFPNAPVTIPVASNTELELKCIDSDSGSEDIMLPRIARVVSSTSNSSHGGSPRISRANSRNIRQQHAHATNRDTSILLPISKMTEAISKAEDCEHYNLRRFWESLAVCHTVIPEFSPDGKIIYKASSPDEGALIRAAAEIGVEFIFRDPFKLVVRICGHENTYEYLHTLSFTSERKRMSVILRCPDGKIRLFCKGADSVIRSCLDNKSRHSDVSSFQDVRTFANQGFRTLCVAYREIDEEFYNEWHPHYLRAQCAIDERAIRVDRIATKIEQNLTLLGITAIEDKLQSGVRPCIESLAAAGIQMWMLTGDMRETAINIGRACGLIQPQMTVISISESIYSDALGKVNDIIARNHLETPNSSQDARRGSFKVSPASSAIALVIDGQSLAFTLVGKCRTRFLVLAQACKVCICCRATPLQKSQVVDLVKSNLKVITLAIGDGANDCSMIQTAHIGIGIFGEEGMQAVRSSDYAIAQFRYLSRLLLIHGRWGYRRLTYFVCYYFYKNIASAFCDLWFTMSCGFSGQIFFADYLSLAFNALWTSWAVLANGVLDRDIPERACLEHPEMYKRGVENKDFNSRVFFGWILSSIFTSLCCYFLVAYNLDGVDSSDGYVNGHFYSSTASFCVLIISVSLRLALATHSWVWVNHVAVWGIQLTFFFISVIFLNISPFVSMPGNWKMYSLIFQLFQAPIFWLLLFTVPIISILPNLASIHYYRNMQKRPDQIFRIQEEIKKQKGQYISTDGF